MFNDQNQPNPLKGKRYVNLIRCSTDQQAHTSPKAQIRINNEFAKRMGMKHVMDIVLEGVSGSKTFNRRDLDKLIEEKKLRDSYDVILFRDFARLTRGGISHGHSVKRNFQQIGVQLRSVTDHIPDGPMGEMMETFLFFQNQEYSRSISRNVVSGLVNSVKSGRRPVGNVPPYGFDKMLLGIDGKPTRLIRWTPTHREIRNPQTGEVYETIPSELHFTKHKFETYCYVLGDPEKVKTVRMMFDLHYKQGFAMPTIVRRLNEANIPAPRGGLWHSAGVRNILDNPLYVGRRISFRQTGALYFHPTAKQTINPTPIDQTLLEGKNRWTMPRVNLSSDHWVETYDAEAAKILDDPEVMKRAAARVQQVLEEWTLKKGRFKKTKWRQVQSRYFLRRVLRMKGFPDMPVSGISLRWNFDRPKPPPRYYSLRQRHVLFKHAQCKRMKKCVPAAPLEEMVFEMIRDTLLDSDFVKASVTENVKRLSMEKNKNAHREALQKESERLALRLDFLMNTLDGANRSRYIAEAEKIQARQQEIKRVLHDVGTPVPETDEKKIVKRVMAMIQELPTLETPDSEFEPLELLMESVVKRLDVDQITREVEAEIVLPRWAMSKGCKIEHVRLSGPASAEDVCANGILEFNTSVSAKPKKRRKIAFFRGKLRIITGRYPVRYAIGPLYQYRRVS